MILKFHVTQVRFLLFHDDFVAVVELVAFFPALSELLLLDLGGANDVANDGRRDRRHPGVTLSDSDRAGINLLRRGTRSQSRC